MVERSESNSFKMQMQYFLISEINNKDNWSNKGQLLGEVNENWNEPSWGVIATWITGERESSGEDGRAGGNYSRSLPILSLRLTGYRPGLMYDIQYYVLSSLMPPAFMHYVSAAGWKGGCMCICVTCAQYASFCFVYLNFLCLLPVVIIAPA